MKRAFGFYSLCLAVAVVCAIDTASAERLSDLEDKTDLYDLDSLYDAFVDENRHLRDTCISLPEPQPSLNECVLVGGWMFKLVSIICFDCDGSPTLTLSIHHPDSSTPPPPDQLICPEALIAGAGEEFSHELCREQDLENVEWTITPQGREPAGEYHIDLDGTFRFVPDVVDENRNFEFLIQRFYCSDTTECTLTVAVQHMDRYFPMDTDGNGLVNINDIALYALYPEQLGEIFSGMTEEQKKSFDCNRDGVYPSIADIQCAVDYVFDTRGR